MRKEGSTAPETSRTVHPTPRTILFDAVGTLIAPDPPVAEAYHAAGCRFGSSLTVDSIRLRFRSAFERQEAQDAAAAHQPTSEHRERQRWRAIVGEVFSDVEDPSHLFQVLWDHFAQPRHWRLYDDVAECWQALQRAGCRLGIASNFDGRLESVCQGHALLAGCRDRFISSQVGHKKPSPEFFRAIERSLGLPPQDFLLVGDDLENDCLAARRAGWQAVLVDRDGRAPPGLTSVPIIRTLRELADGLQKGSGVFFAGNGGE
jgi:putative hydrolase of the HAD superfamily